MPRHGFRINRSHFGGNARASDKTADRRWSTAPGIAQNIFALKCTIMGYYHVYQIEASVPQSALSGDETPVILQIAGQTSPTVTMAIE